MSECTFRILISHVPATIAQAILICFTRKGIPKNNLVVLARVRPARAEVNTKLWSWTCRTFDLRSVQHHNGHALLIVARSLVYAHLGTIWLDQLDDFDIFYAAGSCFFVNVIVLTANRSDHLCLHAIRIPAT